MGLARLPARGRAVAQLLLLLGRRGRRSRGRGDSCRQLLQLLLRAQLLLHSCVLQGVGGLWQGGASKASQKSYKTLREQHPLPASGRAEQGEMAGAETSSGRKHPASVAAMLHANSICSMVSPTTSLCCRADHQDGGRPCLLNPELAHSHCVQAEGCATVHAPPSTI